MSTTDWQSKAKAKRDAVNELIPQAWRLSNIATAEEHRDITGTYLHQFLEPLEIEITESTAEEIVAKTSSGAWKAETVARAFAHRAALVHQHLNCIHEVFFEAAFQNARRLDDYLAEHKKPVGPLHGLPVSLKDQMHVEGVETSMGYVGWLGTFQGKTGTGKERVFESEIVRELRNLGAVLYCKTSVPQTLMCVETVNNIVGYTFNPKNRNLSSGGSSGGEGALIGAKGSPLGFGTDIGGSVRLPSGFCGIYGLRPSQCRMPYEGMANSMDGQNTILSVVGPISGTIGGVRLAMKSLLSQQPWLYDPLVLEIPWREEQCQAVADASKAAGGLSFGILWTDDVHQPFPPVARALRQVADALKRRGHTVVDWNPPSHAEGLKVSAKTWFYDGGIDVRESFALSGEPVHEQIVVGHALTEEAKAMDIAANNVARRVYQKRYMDYWNSTAAVSGTTRPVDAFICPVHHSPAPRPKMFRNASYTTIFNVLDYSGCTFPVTTADKNVDVPNASFKPYSAADEQSQSDYDPEIYHGAHVSLQLVGRRLQEEKVVALVDYVSSVLHGADDGARL